MFEDNGYDLLGFFELGISYASLAFGCVLAEPVIKRTNLKTCLYAGCLGDVLWVAAQIIPAYKAAYNKTSQDSIVYSDTFIYTTNTFGALASGFGSALLWIAEGKYITDCARENTKGFFFGFFWACYMSSQIFGCLFAAYVFKNYSIIGFNIIMVACCALAWIIFLFLGDPEIERADNGDS